MARMLATGSGVVLELIRSGEATTRTDLIEHLGWSRVTLARRLDELSEAGFIVSAGQLDSRGGRPPQEFAVNKDAGLLLAMDIGSSHTRVGITDLISNVLLEDEADIGLFDGPDEIFSWARQVFDFLLRKLEKNMSEVRGIGIGVPGPVDAENGRLGSPQLDPRWDNVRVADYLESFDAVIAVDRDVNILAVGESRLGWPEYQDLVVVKAGIGVGCAYVLDGRIYRGARGGAGQLSAPLRNRLSEPLHRLETVASGATIRDSLTTSVRTSADIVTLANSGDKEALGLLSEVGEIIGYTIADVVGLLNPAAVVIGGNLAAAGEPFIGAIRRAIFSASHPFPRQALVVERSRLGNKAGVRGASLLAQDALFESDRVSRITRKLPKTSTN
ncbi:ROK family protein [Humidisolicoccus flavus]|uniref:ROK family transcriptional regulator n=1 Tax=Humidisolicoccus flavus TaxID=3111414 RepID=UPI0032540296